MRPTQISIVNVLPIAVTKHAAGLTADAVGHPHPIRRGAGETTCWGDNDPLHQRDVGEAQAIGNSPDRLTRSSIGHSPSANSRDASSQDSHSGLPQLAQFILIHLATEQIDADECGSGRAEQSNGRMR